MFLKEKSELKIGKHYLVQGKGNDVFRVGEKVLLSDKQGSVFIFKQGSVEVVIKEDNINKFLSQLELKSVD